MYSTPPRLYWRVQRGEKWLTARRAPAGLAESSSREHNNADGRFSPRPEGASQKRQCGVAVLEKGLPFPADSALH